MREQHYRYQCPRCLSIKKYNLSTSGGLVFYHCHECGLDVQHEVYEMLVDRKKVLRIPYPWVVKNFPVSKVRIGNLIKDYEIIIVGCGEDAITFLYDRGIRHNGMGGGNFSVLDKLMFAWVSSFSRFFCRA